MTATMLALSGEEPPAWLDEDVAGVAMVRGEYVLRASGAYVTHERGRSALRRYLELLCSRFPRWPMWYRLADFEAQEISALAGADIDLVDENPILGARGLRRGLLFPEALAEELAVVAEVARRHANLNLLFSYVGSAAELDQGIDAARRAGFPNRLGSMVEIPSAVTEEFFARELDFAVVGLNDLTSLVLGAHRGGPFHLPTHPYVLEVCRRAVALAHASGTTIAAAGYVAEQDLLGPIAACGFDAVVAHYHRLPDLCGPRFTSLPDLDLFARLNAGAGVRPDRPALVGSSTGERR